jgi:hypothetical protein
MLIQIKVQVSKELVKVKVGLSADYYEGDQWRTQDLVKTRAKS